jgi:hypothetical protein
MPATWEAVVERMWSKAGLGKKNKTLSKKSTKAKNGWKYGTSK